MTEEAQNTPAEATSTTSNARAFMALTFELDREVFAIDVAMVNEVIDPLPLTVVPNADPVAPGLINARGSIIPVLDLQHRLGMRERETTEDTRFVVLDAPVGDDQTKFAVVADCVHEVIEISEDTIQPGPELGIRWPHEFIRGIAEREGQLIIFPNIETVFAPQN